MDTAQTEKIKRGRLSAEGTYGPRQRYMHSGATARQDLSAKLKESNRKEVQLDLSLLGGMEQDADEQEIRPWWRLIERIRDQAERNAATPKHRASGQNSYVESLETITTPTSREQANYNKQSKESNTERFKQSYHVVQDTSTTCGIL